MITKSIKERVREYFFVHPTIKLRVRKIERMVGIPLPAAIRYTKELEKEGILKTIRIEKVVFYAADRSSKQFLLEKRLFNLRLLYTTGLVDHLAREYDNPTMIVFGSYALGEDTEESDIDLYLEMKKRDIQGMRLFERRLQRKLQFFQYTTINILENKELANTIINGITLNGFLDVFR